jgi:hypothetical protein
MLFACWSLKGGSGTTVVSVALACVLGRSHPDGAVLVDLAGDVPAMLGQPEPPGPGAAEWLASGALVAPDGWARLEVPVPPDLHVVPRGRGPAAGGERAEVLAGMLGAGGRPVVVDCGVLSPPGPEGGPAPGAAHVLAASATHSWLVTRACYLALRRAASLPLRPSGVVVLHEPARSLQAADVAAAVGAPVLAQVPYEAAVARAVDRGELASRLPRSLERALRQAA